jgi:hypothetical protein
LNVKKYGIFTLLWLICFLPLWGCSLGGGTTPPDASLAESSEVAPELATPSEETPEEVVIQPEYLLWPCFQDGSAQAGGVALTLPNDESNTASFLFTVEEAGTGELLFQSEEVPPGESAQWRLPDTFAAGTYQVQVTTQVPEEQGGNAMEQLIQITVVEAETSIQQGEDN